MIGKAMDSKPRSETAHRDPEAEIERLKQELQAQRNMYLRAVADCDNYRKRVERDQAKVIRNGRRDLLLSVLEVLDEFERALAHSEQDSGKLVEGVRLLHRLLLNRIAAEGVVAYKSKGEKFDPKLHEATGTVSAGGRESGTVMEEARKGYRWGEEILRPARVIVAQ